MARKLAADADWRRLVFDQLTGALLDYGRRTYRPPAALRDFVRARDQRCRFLSCRQPARQCDLDHTIPYPRGRTSADNLGPLCEHHHRLKTEAGWRLRQLPAAVFEWTSPTGHRYLVEPEPYEDRLWPAEPERPPDPVLDR